MEHNELHSLSNEELQELIFLAEYGVDHLGGEDKCKAKQFIDSVKEKLDV